MLIYYDCCLVKLVSPGHGAALWKAIIIISASSKCIYSPWSFHVYEYKSIVAYISLAGLDPAKPMFIFASGDHKLGKDDAEFVDVIHTDILQRGVLAAAGHVDFYVNGGIEQPGCALQTNSS